MSPNKVIFIIKSLIKTVNNKKREEKIDIYIKCMAINRSYFIVPQNIDMKNLIMICPLTKILSITRINLSWPVINERNDFILDLNSVLFTRYKLEYDFIKEFHYFKSKFKRRI